MTSGYLLGEVKELLLKIESQIESYSLGDRPQSPPAWLMISHKELSKLYVYLRGIQ